MKYSVTNILKELIAIPSQNPMGRSEPGDGFGEHRLTGRLESLFGELDLPFRRQEVHKGRENILARLDGTTDGLVVFEAHQDTVPVDGMTIDPWNPRQEDGRIYGRGACDVKGGMAAMLAALARLCDERPRAYPTVVMACSVNEEHGFSGAEAIGELLSGSDVAFLPRQPDAVIVAEPTELQTVVAHKGAVRWMLHTRGLAAHSATLEQGTNAIYRMAPVLGALKRYQDDELPALGRHGLCGRATLSVGVIRGGLSVNTVPDRCSIEIDRRLMPRETPEQAERQLRQYLNRELGEDAFELDPPFLAAIPLSDSDNGPLASRLQESIRRFTPGGDSVGVPYATDAPYLARLGVPTVVFGPGSIEQAHTKDEWISVDQLETAAEILYDFAVRMGGTPRGA